MGVAKSRTRLNDFTFIFKEEGSSGATCLLTSLKAQEEERGVGTARLEEFICMVTITDASNRKAGSFRSKSITEKHYLCQNSPLV